MFHYFLPLINGGGPLCIVQRLKVKCYGALSNFAFTFDLRRYTKAAERATRDAVSAAAMEAAAGTVAATNAWQGGYSE
jgi:hypothetical protein